MANHVHGQISTKGWGDMLRNATFCFAHQTQPTSRNEEARTKTSYTRFTAAKSTLDATRVLGFAGELCWHILPDRKLSQLRGRAAPAYYVVFDPQASPRPTNTGYETSGPSS